MKKYIFILNLAALFISGCASFVDNACQERNSPQGLTVGESRTFAVIYEKKCNPSGIKLEPEKKYIFSNYSIVRQLEDGEKMKFHPKTGLPLGLDGWSTYEAKWYTWPALAIGGLFRPLTSADWYELVGKVGTGRFFSIAKTRGEFSPKKPGELFALANDFPWYGRYENNHGKVLLTVKCLAKNDN